MDERIDLQFAYESDVLIVRASGRYLVEHVETAAARIIAQLKQQPIKAALVDLRGVTGNLTFMDRYRLGKVAGRHLGFAPVAVLARAEQLDKQRIGLVVARNRGANIELFTELPAAQAWLAKIPARDPSSASG